MYEWTPGIPVEKSKPTILHDEEQLKRAELRKMKAIATTLLLVSFVIFVISSIYVEGAAWIGFVQATAEAAMVGALADWFAVTALFRYPLGLKIPHTAIIPNRKDEIGASLGHFIKANFLIGDVISEKLRATNIAQTVALWLIEPANSALIARHVTIGLATVVRVMKNEDVQDLIERSVAIQLRTTQIAPLLGKFLAFITSGERQQELLQGTVKLGMHLLEENKAAVLAKIGRETPWWLPKNVDLAIYQKMANSLEETLQNVNADPNHPLYDHFNALINRFVADLQHSPAVRAKEAIWKEELLQDSLVQDFSASLWHDVKTALIERSTEPDVQLQQSIQQGLISFGEAVLADPELLNKLNAWFEGGVLYLIEQYGYEAEHLIAHTIRRWDAEGTSRKIELQVGKDLQFIRINGTLVGGLAGFVIHAISLLL